LAAFPRIVTGPAKHSAVLECSRVRVGLSRHNESISAFFFRRGTSANKYRQGRQLFVANMPHRVADFFRKNSIPLDLPVDLTGKPRRLSGSRPSLSDRSSTASSASSLASEDKSAKMPDAYKRLSFPGRSHSPRSSSKSLAHQSATLDVVIESPPLVFYGPAESSSGALLSGQIVLNVHDEALPIDSFKMRLALEVTRKKPFHAHCQDCMHQSTDLTTWNFLPGPATLRKGRSMPWSLRGDSR